MSACSGDPKNCSFCGSTPVDCAKHEVTGCTANPTQCTVCEGKGCVAVECTGNVDSCPACKGNFSSCRKQQFSATEGVEHVQKPAHV
ncbi:hypothetical protein TREMEDRAFT_57526 [Tremella mesenterica DSM 1558]|uniref:uncharacterized protein n=1 Tax=Tremella mesenterica (strain ATCC 24925 / CBS 8224 / DSM 1558 / NBRC 9311 / NRRL Y-6157 / RJB 2259-6 / UBC 559-6) TaxID=578456 RepID=UPI0003F49EBE|nr:uncharacterized protein TREMEDRAFT_57526 [Tremella mesenterica DSM 1558]EIW67732.1 hypothetical protein TREMEDRAFT_57526 [Tremella mesenterica DSM 1558]